MIIAETKKREYNVVYGFMPVEIVNHLSQEDRHKMFLDWITREPTETGWFITKTIIHALGEEFLDFVVRNVMDSLDPEDYESREDFKKEVVDLLTSTVERFASDINTLYEYIEDFKETGGSLQVKDIDLLDVPVTEPEVPVEKKSKKTKKTTGRTKTTKKSGQQKRDSKGRFLKK